MLAAGTGKSFPGNDHRAVEAAVALRAAKGWLFHHGEVFLRFRGRSGAEYPMEDTTLPRFSTQQPFLLDHLWVGLLLADSVGAASMPPGMAMLTNVSPA